MRQHRLIKTALVLSLAALLQTIAPESQARTGDDAVVLPKGIWRLFFDAEFYIPFDERFNRDGDVEALGKDLNTNLNSSIFPALAPLNVFVPGGVASLGNSVVSYKRDLQQYLFQPAYGLTDRLTIGVNIPYVHVKNNIGPNLNTATANVGKNPFFACGAAICPLTVPFTSVLTVQDVQNLLGGGLDVNGNGTIDVAGLGFKPVQTWEKEGIGDIDVGGRYQYFRSDYFRAAFTGGARFPTGYKDDPDNLVDTAWGAGTYALLFRFNQDLMLQPEGLGRRLGFPEPGTGLINTTISYDLNLPDKESLRVCSPRAPACTAKDDVRRDLGDRLQAEISGKVGLFYQGLILSPLYIYGQKFKDAYSGDRTLPYGDLAIDTDQTEHIFILSLIYTSIPAFVQKQFPFPFYISVSYRDRFAGSNAVKSQFIGLTIAAYF